MAALCGRMVVDFIFETAMTTIPVRVRTERPDEPVLSGAILLYQGHTGGTFATVHEVAVSDKGKPTILAGKPLTHATSRAILASLSRNAAGGSFLPECVLMTSGNELLWYEPPQMRHLGFRESTQFPERSPGTLAGTVPTPGVIFHVSESKWRVFAYASKGRPVPDTPLFHAPTLNTYEDGAICVGTVKTPGSTATDCIRAWSDAFWCSNFTHANYGGVVKYHGDAAKLWRDAMNGKFGGRFPNRVLKPHDFTVGQYIERLRRLA